MDELREGLKVSRLEDDIFDSWILLPFMVCWGVWIIHQLVIMKKVNQSDAAAKELTEGAGKAGKSNKKGKRSKKD